VREREGRERGEWGVIQAMHDVTVYRFLIVLFFIFFTAVVLSI